MNEINEISSAFDEIFENRYKGHAIDLALVKLEQTISEITLDTNERRLILEKIQSIARKDIEFYVRVMNWTIECSMICISYLFMKSALQLIQKQCDGKIDSLLSDNNNIWAQIFFNAIRIIVKNELLKEVEISTSTGNVVIGKETKSIVSIMSLKEYTVDVLHLLQKKYVQILIDSEFELSNSDLISNISNLNCVYKQYTESEICDIVGMVYSKEKLELYISYESNLKPNDYDELLFEKYGYLFFPLVTDIAIENDKISILNEGYGSLDNCRFCIKHNNKCILDTEIEVENYKNYLIYIDDKLKNQIKDINSNELINFCIKFDKFNRTYEFTISKKMGVIKESISKQGTSNMNIQINQLNNAAFISDSSNFNITFDSEQKQELINNLETIIKNVDSLNVEDDDKAKVKSKIEQAIGETRKINANIAFIKELVQESGILLKNVSSIPLLYQAVSYLKVHLGV